VTSPPAGAPRTEAEIAIAHVNDLRAPLGILPLELDARLSRAATNAARYASLNKDDPTAWDGNPHYEVVGKPGFTGRTPSDRCRAVGYPGGCGEVKHYIGDPVASVDGWMATLYHRFPLISPFYSAAGYGMSLLNEYPVDVINVSSATGPRGWISARPYLWVYPYDGQTNVPPQWNGAEWPNPLPPGAQGPVGYTISVEGIRGTWQITAGELRDSSGALIPVHPTPADCTDTCYAMISVAPLRPFTEYTVTVRGTLDGASFMYAWRFTTGAPIDVSAASVGGPIIGPPEEEPQGAPATKLEAAQPGCNNGLRFQPGGLEFCSGRALWYGVAWGLTAHDANHLFHCSRSVLEHGFDREHGRVRCEDHVVPI
jgi:hypothetical protein